MMLAREEIHQIQISEDNEITNQTRERHVYQVKSKKRYDFNQIQDTQPFTSDVKNEVKLKMDPGQQMKQSQTFENRKIAIQQDIGNEANRRNESKTSNNKLYILGILLIILILIIVNKETSLLEQTHNQNNTKSFNETTQSSTVL